MKNGQLFIQTSGCPALHNNLSSDYNFKHFQTKEPKNILRANLDLYAAAAAAAAAAVTPPLPTFTFMKR